MPRPYTSIVTCNAGYLSFHPVPNSLLFLITESPHTTTYHAHISDAKFLKTGLIRKMPPPMLLSRYMRYYINITLAGIAYLIFKSEVYGFIG